MNQIHAIQPYKWNGQWVFDDYHKGLKREAFVGGSNDIIEHFAEGKNTVILLFSAEWFPKTFKFTWVKEEHGGNWYYNEVMDMKGWLCPALLKYFDEAPKELYIQFR